MIDVELITLWTNYIGKRLPVKLIRSIKRYACQNLSFVSLLVKVVSGYKPVVVTEKKNTRFECGFGLIV